MVEKWARELTEEVLGGPPVRKGGRYLHPVDGAIEVIDGQYWGQHGVSNFWYWTVLSTGERNQGYADRWPEMPSTSVRQLAERHNGAIQVEAATEMPLVVFLGGPIKHWWGFDSWDEGLPKQYFEWRDAVEVAFVEAGFLLYMPHHAWRGRWWEPVQGVNDSAVKAAHVLVYLTPEGVPADGTDEEVAVAERHGIRTVHLPPGSDEDLQAAVQALTTLQRQLITV